MNSKEHVPSYIFFTLCAIITLCCIAACGTPDGNNIDGKRWYNMHNCSSCHGPTGNDGRAPNIANIDMRFGSFLRKLRKTNAPIMRGFPEEKLSKQDAADIYAYLQNIKEKKE